MDQRPANPFKDTYGAYPHPQFRLDRAGINNSVLAALESSGNSDAGGAFFFTGPVGYGKSCLLLSLSELAKNAGWQTIEATPSRAVSSIVSQLSGRSPVVKAEVTPKVGIPGGPELVLSGKASAESGSAPVGPGALLKQRVQSLVKSEGVLITIDDAHRVPEQDMAELCYAMQLARRDSLPLVFVFAGPPDSKRKAETYAGCEFMCYVEEQQLGPLPLDDIAAVYRRIPQLATDFTELDDELAQKLASMSQGHPYLVQLVGYTFVEALRKACPVGMYRATVQDAEAVEGDVYARYCKGLLIPNTRNLGHTQLRYLVAMDAVADEQGLASTRDVASQLGKSVKQLADCRGRLVQRHLILPAGRGKVRFALPYLARYAQDRLDAAD